MPGIVEEIRDRPVVSFAECPNGVSHFRRVKNGVVSVDYYLVNSGGYGRGFTTYVGRIVKDTATSFWVDNPTGHNRLFPTFWAAERHLTSQTCERC